MQRASFSTSRAMSMELSMYDLQCYDGPRCCDGCDEARFQALDAVCPVHPASWMESIADDVRNPEWPCITAIASTRNCERHFHCLTLVRVSTVDFRTDKTTIPSTSPTQETYLSQANSAIDRDPMYEANNLLLEHFAICLLSIASSS